MWTWKDGELGVDLGKVGEGQTLIRIQSMKRNPVFNKKSNI